MYNFSERSQKSSYATIQKKNVIYFEKFNFNKNSSTRQNIIYFQILFLSQNLFPYFVRTTLSKNILQ